MAELNTTESVVSTNWTSNDNADASGDIIYNTNQPPEDLISTHCQENASSGTLPTKATYGIDSPLGLALSNIGAPLYLYATLKGKFDLWDKLLADIPADLLCRPSLDVGCGRGLVLLKIAQLKRALPSSTPAAKAYAIDIFVKGDQAGNAPSITAGNAAALGVLPQVALHCASFTRPFPFANGIFGLVTASLSLHNAEKAGRKSAMREIARVCQPGALLIIVDFVGYVSGYRDILRSEGWPKDSIDVSWAGPGVMFGAFPVQVLKATRPLVS